MQHTQNTPNPTTGLTPPNSDLSPEEGIALDALPAVSDAEMHFNALVCLLEQAGAVLRLMINAAQAGAVSRLMINDVQGGTVSDPLVPALYALESLLELCDEPHSRLCGGLGRESEPALKTGYLLEQVRAVTGFLLDALTGDEPPATTVSNGLGALNSLLGLVRAELRRVSLETLAQASQEGAGDARL